MIREPAASAGPQIVVADSIPTGRGGGEPTVPRVDRDVGGLGALSEQQPITNGERAHRWLDSDSRSRHLPRSSRQVDSLNAIDVLNESGAIKSGSRCSPAVPV